MSDSDRDYYNKEIGECFTPDSLASLLSMLVGDDMAQPWPQKTVHDPTCGNGQLLVNVLERKLDRLEHAEGLPHDLDQCAIVALASVSGIDIMADNVDECRARLARTVCDWAQRVCGVDLRAEAAYITGLNIVHGDTLTNTVVGTDEPIRFPDWGIFHEQGVN